MQGCFLDHSHVFFKHSSHIVELLRTRLDPSVECYLMKKRLNCLKRQKKKKNKMKLKSLKCLK